MFHVVSVPTRLFNEQEVGEEITPAVPPEKTELVEDQVMAVYGLLIPGDHVLSCFQKLIIYII